MPKYEFLSLTDRSKLYDISKNILVRTYVGHEQYVFAVTISSDNKMIISGSDDDTVRFWRIADGDLLLKLDCNGVTSITVSGSSLAVGTYDSSVLLFTDHGDLMKKLEGVDKHTHKVSCARFSHFGRYLITASYDRTVKKWNHSTGEVLRTFRGHQVTFSSFCSSAQQPVLTF